MLKEYTSEKLLEVMETMTPEARMIFEKLILQLAAQKPIQRIRRFVDKFEDDCPLDNLIGRIVMQVIDEVGSNVQEDMEAVQASGSSSYSGHQAAKIAIREIRKIVDSLESTIDDDGCEKSVEDCAH